MAYTLTLQEKMELNSTLSNLASSGSKISIKSVTADYGVTFNDFRTFLSCSGNFAITLPNAALLIDGFHLFIKNNGSGSITVQTGVGTQKIDNERTRVIYPNETIMIIGNTATYFSFHAGSFIIP